MIICNAGYNKSIYEIEKEKLSQLENHYDQLYNEILKPDVDPGRYESLKNELWQVYYEIDRILQG